MLFSASNERVRKVVGIFISVCLIGAPLSDTFTLKKAEAQLFGGGGRIVFDPQNTLTNTLQTGLMTSLQLKELTLDGLFRNIAQKALQQLTGDILSFINTGGQDVNGVNDGRPTFVTDLTDRLDEITYDTESELIYSEALSTICTPFQLDVRIALVASLQAKLDTAEGRLQKEVACTIDSAEVDISAVLDINSNEGGLSTLLGLALNPQNTPAGALRISQRIIEEASAKEKAEFLEDYRNGNGFPSLKTCTDISTPSGTQQKCTISTPGILLQTQMSEATNAPMESLLNADEFDEVIGNLFGNLAQQAIGGINGLLGLSDNIHGAGGNQSYFDAIKNDPTNTSNNGVSGLNPIASALETERRVGSSTIDIVNAIQNLTRCSPDVVIPVELQGVLTEFTPKVIAVAGVVATLSDMALTYASSTSARQQGALLSQLETMRTNGVLAGLAIAIEYEQFLNVDLANFIRQFKLDTGYVEVRCEAPLTS